jgi:ubiquinone biosynthesis protein
VNPTPPAPASLTRTGDTEPLPLPAGQDPSADAGLAPPTPQPSTPASPLEAPPPPAAEIPPPGFELLLERPVPGLLRRFFTTHRHLAGMLFGGLVDLERRTPVEKRKGLRFRATQLSARIARPLLDRKLRDLPFPVQFRRRLEILGPTYIKLGQVLSLRQDILPTTLTDELKNLLDRLPVVPFPRYLELVAEDLRRPVGEMFSWIDPVPVGSASIAQTHRATTVEGDDVILKVVKPGIREILRRDAVLLRGFGRFLDLFLARYRPRQVIDEFVTYTLREIDLRREADNAETFAANFRDLPAVAFPKIYRRYSGERVLSMEFFDGFKPSDPRAQELSEAERDHLIDTGAAAIILMLYRDGFFHADLHPGNLIVLPPARGTWSQGGLPRCGFIDLGMVGRFDEDLRKSMLYYFYCLVTADAENAARYLTGIAQMGPGADPAGFHREIEDVSRRWSRSSTFTDFSLAQLILESVGRAGHFRMYFPVEMVLMVKALITFEGVGQMLKPGFDVATVAQRHVNAILLHQFSPLRIAKESLRGAPEVIDALVKAPMLITEGLRVLERTTRSRPENPFAGLRGTLFGGFCMVAGAILAASDGPWVVVATLFVVGLLLAIRKGT